jgi:uncharacterized tellurite resistance protein B-like protein
MGFIARPVIIARTRSVHHANSTLASFWLRRTRHGVRSPKETTMELSELNKDEQIALAGLLEFVVLASGHVTEDEEQEIDAIIEALGEDTYRSAVAEIDKRFPDETALRTFLSGIERQDAREVIYGTIIEAAMTDTMEGRESELLEWLAKTWNIEVTYEVPPTENEAS